MYSVDSAECHFEKYFSTVSRYYLAELEPEKLEAYFQFFDIPQSAVKDPEVQAEVDEWLQTLPQVPEQRIPKQVAQQAIDILNRLFKS